VEQEWGVWQDVTAKLKQQTGRQACQRTGKQVVPVGQVGQSSRGGAGRKRIRSGNRWWGRPWVAPRQPADRESTPHQLLQTACNTACRGGSCSLKHPPLAACLPAHPQKKLEPSSLEAKPTTVELKLCTASGTSAAAAGPGATVVERGN
jgi:hypothetical protein